MLTIIGLVVVFFVLVSLFVQYKKSLEQKPMETYVRISGQNGKKFHEWKNL